MVDQIRTSIKRGKIKSPDDMRAGLREALIKARVALRSFSAGLLWQPQLSIVQAQVLTSHGKSPTLELGGKAPGVVLVIGVNGGGKTTTIGKLAHQLTQGGATVSAAAVESRFGQLSC